MAARVSQLSSGGAASRRRGRRLRSFWGHEQSSIKIALACAKHHSFQYRASVGVQTDEALSPVGEYVAPAAAPYAATADITQLLEPPIPDKFVALVSADTYTSLSHMTEYVTPAVVDLHAAIDHAAPSSTATYATPAPEIEYAALAHTVTFTAPLSSDRRRCTSTVFILHSTSISNHL